MRSLKHRLQRLEQQMIPEEHELIRLIVMPAGAKRPDDIDKLPETPRPLAAVGRPTIRLIVVGKDGPLPAGIGGQRPADRPLAEGNSR